MCIHAQNVGAQPPNPSLSGTQSRPPVRLAAVQGLAVKGVALADDQRSTGGRMSAGAANEVAGRWSQLAYGASDVPSYTARGRWNHRYGV